MSPDNSLFGGGEPPIMVESLSIGGSRKATDPSGAAHDGLGCADRASVAELLKNPFYAGDFFWDGKRYQGKHPPIID